MSNNNYSFINLFTLLTRWRKVLILNFVIVAIVSLVISIMLPKWYKASATILPPEENGIGSGFASLLNSLPMGGLGLGGGSGSEMTYMAILKSHDLQRDVIDKYDLQSFYETKTIHETLIAFGGDYDVQFTEENMIKISFEYTDSIKVAEIVNYIVYKLGKTSTLLTLERAENTKGFIETRYFKNLSDIDSLSNEMKMFQDQHGVLELEEQTKALINSIAEIEASVFVNKAELESIKKNFGNSSPQFLFAQTQLENLIIQLNKLKFGKKNKGQSSFHSLFLPVNKIPELAQKYTKLYAEILLQAKLQEFLLPEYEQAKLQLLKKKPTLQIIDHAIPPDKKSKPKKALVVIGSVMIALILNFILILFIEHLKWLKENQPEEYSKIVKIKKAWLNPFSKFS